MAEDSSQIREAIAETRSEIADTVQALGEKADVKSRISETVNEKTAELKTKASALQDTAREVLPEWTPSTVTSDPTKKRAVAIAAAAALLLMMLRRRRRRHRS